MKIQTHQKNLKNLTMFLLIKLTSTINALKSTNSKTLLMHKSGTRIIPTSDLLDINMIPFEKKIYIHQSKKIFLDLYEKGNIKFENSYRARIVNPENNDILTENEIPFYTKKFSFGFLNKQFVIFGFKKFFKIFEVKEYDLDFVLRIGIEDLSKDENANFTKIFLESEGNKTYVLTAIKETKEKKYSMIPMRLVVLHEDISKNKSDEKISYVISPKIMRIRKIKIFDIFKNKFLKFCDAENIKINFFFRNNFRKFYGKTIVSEYCDLEKEAKKLNKPLKSIFGNFIIYEVSVSDKVMFPIAIFERYNFFENEKFQENQKKPQIVKIIFLYSSLLFIDLKGAYSLTLSSQTNFEKKSFSPLKFFDFEFNMLECNEMSSKEIGCIFITQTTAEEKNLRYFEFVQSEPTLYMIPVTFRWFQNGFSNIERVFILDNSFVVIEKKEKEFEFTLFLKGRIYPKYTVSIPNLNKPLKFLLMNHKNLDSKIFQGNILTIEKLTGNDQEFAQISIYSVLMSYFEFTPLNYDLSDQTCQGYISDCISTEINITLREEGKKEQRVFSQKYSKIFLIDERKFSGLLRKKNTDDDEITRRELFLDSKGDLKIDLDSQFYGLIESNEVVKNIRVGRRTGKELKVTATKPTIELSDIIINLKIDEEIYKEANFSKNEEIEKMGEISFISTKKNSILIVAEIITKNQELCFQSLIHPTYFSPDGGVFVATKQNTVLLRFKKFKNLKFQRCFYPELKLSTERLTFDFLCLFENTEKELIVHKLNIFLKDANKTKISPTLLNISKIIDSTEKIKIIYLEKYLEEIPKSYTLATETHLLFFKYLPFVKGGNFILFSKIKFKDIGIFDYREKETFTLKDILRWKKNTYILVFEKKSSLSKIVTVVTFISKQFSLSIIGSFRFESSVILTYASRKTFKMTVLIKENDTIWKFYEFDIERDLLYRENPKENFNLEPTKISPLYIDEKLSSYYFDDRKEKIINLSDFDENFRIILEKTVREKKFFSVIFFQFVEHSQVEFRRIEMIESRNLSEINFYHFNGDSKKNFQEHYQILTNSSSEDLNKPIDGFFVKNLLFLNQKKKIIIKNPIDLFEKSEIRSSNKSEVLRLRFKDRGGIVYEELFHFKYNEKLKFSKISENRKKMKTNEKFNFDYSSLGGIVTKSWIQCPEGFKTAGYQIGKRSLDKVECENEIQKFIFSGSKAMKKIENSCKGENCHRVNLKEMVFYNDLIFTLEDNKLKIYNFKNKFFQEIFSLRHNIKYKTDSQPKKKLNKIDYFMEHDILKNCEKIFKIEKEKFYYNITLSCNLRQDLLIFDRYLLETKINRTDLENYIKEKRFVKNVTTLFHEYVLINPELKILGKKVFYYQNIFFNVKKIRLRGMKENTYLDILLYTKDTKKLIYSSLSRKNEDVILENFWMLNYQNKSTDDDSGGKIFLKFVTANLHKGCPSKATFNLIRLGFLSHTGTNSSTADLYNESVTDPNSTILNIFFGNFGNKENENFDDLRRKMSFFLISDKLLIEGILDFKLVSNECVYVYREDCDTFKAYRTQFYSLEGLCLPDSSYHIQKSESLLVLICLKNDYLDSNTKIIFFKRRKQKKLKNLKNDKLFADIRRHIYVAPLPLQNDIDEIKIKILEESKKRIFLVISMPNSVLSSYRFNFDMQITYFEKPGALRRLIDLRPADEGRIDLLVKNEQFSKKINLEFSNRFSSNCVVEYARNHLFFLGIISFYCGLLALLANIKELNECCLDGKMEFMWERDRRSGKFSREFLEVEMRLKEKQERESLRFFEKYD